MKFLITKELKHNPALSLLVLLFVSLLSVYLISDLIVYHFRIGLTFPEAQNTLLGNENIFLEPIIFDVLLEHAHMNLFTSMITLMLLSIIYMRVRIPQKNTLIHVSFISAIIAPITLILSSIYGNIFILMWIGSFVLWHLCGIFLAILIFRYLSSGS